VASKSPDIGCDLYRRIYKLTQAGVFKGHQPARTVLVHFAMNIDPENPASLYVDPGSITQREIMSCTALSASGVGTAMKYLEAQGLVTVTRNHKRTISVRVELGDAE
jgi:DNA-binding MarR family transcriptional regulator